MKRGLVILQVGLIILKLCNIITISWGQVLIPVFILGIWIFLDISFLFIIFLLRK